MAAGDKPQTQYRHEDDFLRDSLRDGEQGSILRDFPHVSRQHPFPHTDADLVQRQGDRIVPLTRVHIPINPDPR